MSFSSKVKEELSKDCNNPRHCCIAETAAIISMCGKVIFDEKDRVRIEIHTENVTVARKYFTLLKKTYNINTDISIRHSSSLNKSRSYILSVNDDETARKILMTCRLMKPFGVIEEDFSISDSLIIQRECCKRAFIRGAFLASGSVSDPVKTYHFEIVCLSEAKAKQLQMIMETFNINARVIKRRKYFVVYVKDSSQVVDLLNIMGAYNALMDMENVRIVKDMRNNVNRKVNCETANINKTVSAAVKQIEDIRFIQMSSAFDELPESLQEMAELRVRYPEATLAELGQLLDTPVGKSGVNHRLKKISLFADELRERHQQ
ncbi:DNA-binding protein WhiA [Coprococcus catus]|uniref:DNA-binding protein WhiA n=1 Tax=Coprococcus catus TaxID=116085 RepID=UPI0015BCFB4E|nr:DNA-binding protein WhiA [Coprococcus catus]MBT9771877.1 DNA-binding protein WhiA [Coprococcus catus]MBX9232223.1 DNA-binding protein WhiA [Coprococcus catus]MCT6800909.1 DNA-binding protein WhiA [Coprococcus catus]MEE0142522.1 DNA-binding protein WhiA [Coprococcus sp.]